MLRHDVQASVEIVLIENFLNHCRPFLNLQRTTLTRPGIKTDLICHRQFSKLTSNSAQPFKTC